MTQKSASIITPREWSKQKNQSLTQSQFDKLWAMTIPLLPVATKKGFRKSKPADMSMAYARKLLRKELKAKLEAEAAAVQTNDGA